MDVSSDEEDDSVESAKLGSTSGDFEAFLVDDSGVTEQKESVIRVWQSTKARILYEASSMASTVVRRPPSPSGSLAWTSSKARG